MKLGLENKKKTMWAAILGVAAVAVFAYEFIPFFTESSSPTSSAQAAAPTIPHTPPSRPTGKAALKLGKRPKVDSLDPTLRLDLLASAERTQYEGNGRNIFVSQAEDVRIPTPVAPGNTETGRDAFDSGKRGDVALNASIEIANLFGRASVGHDRKIHG